VLRVELRQLGGMALATAGTTSQGSVSDGTTGNRNPDSCYDPWLNASFMTCVSD
jgi:hypothetical protein